MHDSSLPISNLLVSLPAKPKMWRRVNTTTIRVNLDHTPTLPFDGAKRAWCRGKKNWVTIELRRDELFIDGKKVILHLEPEQKNGSSLQGYSLRKQLTRTQVLHPNVMDAIVEAELVPNSWKVDERNDNHSIYFWAVGFRDSGGNLYVRHVCWHNGSWQRYYRRLDLSWYMRNPVAVAI